MNHIMREELLALLLAVPEKTIFILGTPPEGAERTLSFQVFAQLSPENADRIQRIAQELPSLTPEKIGRTEPNTPPLSTDELETIEAIRSGKAKVILTPSQESITEDKKDRLLEGIEYQRSHGH